MPRKYKFRVAGYLMERWAKRKLCVECGGSIPPNKNGKIQRFTCSKECFGKFSSENRKYYNSSAYRYRDLNLNNRDDLSKFIEEQLNGAVINGDNECVLV